MLKNFAEEQFDVIIQAGQSNSDGTGFGEASHPYAPNDRVWYLNGDFTITQAGEAVAGNRIQSNYSLSFAAEYLEKGLLEPGRKLLILRTSVGASGFLDHRWGLEDDLFLRMMEMTRTALEMNPGNRLVAFLWHQGEMEAAFHASYETHYQNLSAMLERVRTVFSCPKLPFVAGDFVQHWKQDNLEIAEPVAEAIRDVCKNCGGKFVETQGLLSNVQDSGCDDPIHFSRESLYLLGKRYFQAFEELLNSNRGE